MNGIDFMVRMDIIFLRMILIIKNVYGVTMKKKLLIALACLCVFGLFGCTKAEQT